MTIFKQGGHRLFEHDPETAKTVSDMLLDLEKNGMDAVRKYSKRVDDWNPERFELGEREIAQAIAGLNPRIVEDTDYCQDNVRRFAEAQLRTMLPLEVETRKGVILGHKHIPLGSVASYIPGGRYPMFGSAQMSIIPAKVAGVKTVLAFTPPVKGSGFYPATVNAIKKRERTGSSYWAGCRHSPSRPSAWGSWRPSTCSAGLEINMSPKLNASFSGAAGLTFWRARRRSSS